MGAGAAVPSPPKPNKAMMNSSRVSARSTNSVRAMALKNHARQENRFISQDGLSTTLRRSMPRKPGDDMSRGYRKSKIPSPDSIEEVPDAARTLPVNEGQFQESLETSENKVDVVPKDIPPPSEVSGVSEGNNVGSLRQFKMNMKLDLKIGVEDDADWGKVSDDDGDDDDDDEDGLNLSQFDKNLIEIPLDTANLDKDSEHTKDKEDGRVQYKNDGTLVVGGLHAGVGAEGIIRGKKDNRHYQIRKLPMRDRLTVLCKLGHGASSAVYKALDLTDLRLVALKMIHVNDRDKRDQFVRELRALFQLLREHSRRSSIHMPKKNRRPEKYIVDFYDAFSNMEDGVVSLMIEYMDGGSLQDIVDQGGCDDEPTLANIAVQALKGLLFLHESYQIHRDLKPGNFLISHRGEVKVADLGILKQLAEPPGSKAKGPFAKKILPKTQTFVGTTTYMSPERIDGKEYSFPADVWAFGLSILTIAQGQFPIDTQGGYWTILHGIRDAPPPSLPATFSPEARDFVACCLNRNPDERKTVAELLKHPFLRKTVVEDLTYDQSYERGKQELLSIIDAVYAHLKALVIDVEERTQSGQFSEEQRPQYARTFGDLHSTHPKDILKRVILGKFSESGAGTAAAGASIEGGGGGGGPSKRVGSRRQPIRPRLTTLAKQLHLPIDKVEQEAKAYIDTLE